MINFIKNLFKKKKDPYWEELKRQQELNHIIQRIELMRDLKQYLNKKYGN
jgi:hypothetical protein